MTSELSKSKLKASDFVTVPNNHVGHVCVKSEFVNTNLIVEGGIRETGHVYPRCVIRTNEDGEAVLPVLNLSAKGNRRRIGSRS